MGAGPTGVMEMMGAGEDFPPPTGGADGVSSMHASAIPWMSYWDIPGQDACTIL